MWGLQSVKEGVSHLLGSTIFGTMALRTGMEIKRKRAGN